MYIFCMIVLVFFAMIGLCVFALSIIRTILDRGDDNEYLIVIPHISAEDAEYRIRAGIRKINDIGKGNILCLCDEEDIEAADICQRMKRECPYLELVSKTTLKQILNLE